MSRTLIPNKKTELTEQFSMSLGTGMTRVYGVICSLASAPVHVSRLNGDAYLAFEMSKLTAIATAAKIEILVDASPNTFLPAFSVFQECGGEGYGQLGFRKFLLDVVLYLAEFLRESEGYECV